MKKLLLTLIFVASLSVFSQEHFTGLNTSSRTGILTAGFNPAELTNMTNHFETNFFGSSFTISNNKVGFADLMSNQNLKDLVFMGRDAANMRFDFETYGPGFAMKWNKWAFGITTKVVAKMDIVDIDTKIGEAVTNSVSNLLTTSTTTIANNYNQRVSGTTWGELGFTIARKVYENDNNKFSGGVTFKLLFPGSYANLGADQFHGTITSTTTGQTYMSTTSAHVNIAYSGTLANDFSNFSDYAKSLYGSLNGFATDLGCNYQWKDKVNHATKNSKYTNKYKLNAGISLRNLGSMTFKDANNKSTDYNLTIPPATPANPGLNLNQFNNTSSLIDVENVLIQSGYLHKTVSNKDFKVKLPTMLTVYTDVKIISKLYVSAYAQKKVNPDNENDQVTSQNILTLTPRFNSGYFEIFSPWSSAEVSGITGGLGIRVGGFYLGSGSVVTAVLNDTKQADLFLGFRWGFL